MPGRREPRPPERRRRGGGAGSTAILATLGEDERQATIDLIEPYLPRFTRMSGEKLRDVVDATRKSGFAESWGHVVDGVYGLGMAVRQGEGPASFAISIAVHQTLATDPAIAGWKRSLRAGVEDHLGATPL